jgi:hypothetical protein
MASLSDIRSQADYALKKLYSEMPGVPFPDEMLDRTDIVQVLTFGLLAKTLPPGEALNTYQQETEFIQFLTRWASLSFPTFHLTPDAAGAAILTDCAGLIPSDLQFPFPCFVLQLPSPSPLLITDAQNRIVEAGSVLVQRYWTAEGDLHAFGGLEMLKKVLAAPHSERFRITLVGRNPDSTLVFTRAPASCSSIQSWLISAGSSAGLLDEIWPGAAVLSVEDAAALKAAIRLVTNTVVYITDLRARRVLQQNGKKRKGTQQRHLSWSLPGPVKLGPELLAAARSTLDAEPQWRLKSRFVVRGHWRNQPCGPGRQERKLLWIAPYWKGPAEGEVLDRTYEIGQAKD